MYYIKRHREKNFNNTKIKKNKRIKKLSKKMSLQISNSP